MSYWDYRIVLHDIGKYKFYTVVEAYYNDSGEIYAITPSDGHPDSNVCSMVHDIDKNKRHRKKTELKHFKRDLKRQFKDILRAFDKPVIVESELKFAKF